jgi:ATP-dependent DNA helicase RecG
MLNEDTDKKSTEIIEKSIEKTGKSIEKTGKSIEKSTEKILKLISENPFITTAQLSENIGISIAAINKQITKLKKLTLLRRDGADKGGKWVVIDKEKK